jgi:hypothetical protein
VIGPRAASILEQIRGLGEHHSAVEARLRESHETCTEELEEAAAAFEMALRKVGRETDDPETPPGNSAEPNPGDAAQDAPPALDDAAASRELERMLARIRTADEDFRALHERMDQVRSTGRQIVERRGSLGRPDAAQIAEFNRLDGVRRRSAFLQDLLEPLLPIGSILMILALALLLLRPVLVTKGPGSRATSSTERIDAR